MLGLQLKAYLHNDEEVRLKTIIWTEMNKEYLEVVHQPPQPHIFQSLLGCGIFIGVARGGLKSGYFLNLKLVNSNGQDALCNEIYDWQVTEE